MSETLYKIELNLEEIHDLNRVFRQFDTIEELFTEFFQNLDESKIIIIKEENKINLIIVVEFMGKKNEVEITLMPEQDSYENIL